ncbi:MAG: hypothetical protein JSW16_06485 [Dehalococcoidales bacterium]|nr:MAG: hypothetical protein JSW16_06485 [Dehalococcoidales bacterium]
MKKPDLLVLVAVWEFISAFLALIGISAIAVFAIPDVCRMWGPALTGGAFGLGIAIFALVCYLCLAVAGGIGLLGGREWGRVLSIAHSAISVFFFPFGTVIGILAIVYLTRADVRDYFTGGSPG